MIQTYEISFRFKGAEQEASDFLEALKRFAMDQGGVIGKLSPLRKIGTDEYFSFFEMQGGNVTGFVPKMTENKQVAKFLVVKKSLAQQTSRRKARPMRERPARQEGEAKTAGAESKPEQKASEQTIGAGLEQKLKEILSGNPFAKKAEKDEKPI